MLNKVRDHAPLGEFWNFKPVKLLQMFLIFMNIVTFLSFLSLKTNYGRITGRIKAQPDTLLRSPCIIVCDIFKRIETSLCDILSSKCVLFLQNTYDINLNPKSNEDDSAWDLAITRLWFAVRDGFPTLLSILFRLTRVWNPHETIILLI